MGLRLGVRIVFPWVNSQEPLWFLRELLENLHPWGPWHDWPYKIPISNRCIFNKWWSISQPVMWMSFGGVHNWMFPKIGGFYPPKWMVKIMETPIKMDDLGVFPYFWKHPIKACKAYALLDFFKLLQKSYFLQSRHTVDGWNPANQLIGSLSHYFQGFIHPSWCRISSINRSDALQPQSC